MAATRSKKPARKTAAKKTAARKKTAPARKKTAARKASGAKKKTGAAAAARKGASRKYSRKASSKVGEELHEMKRGKLRSGGSGKKVTSRKQAIAIGLSEARRSGAKMPPKPPGPKKSS